MKKSPAEKSLEPTFVLLEEEDRSQSAAVTSNRHFERSSNRAAIDYKKAVTSSPSPTSIEKKKNPTPD
ncbi:MAG: hypothetical protein ACYCQJ_08750 [Nitrososphaerales archaeon]